MLSDEERIDNLIEAYSVAMSDWSEELNNDFLRQRMTEAEDALRDKIRAIIAERDALKAAMKSHRGE